MNVQSIVNAVSNGINAEINNLRDEANNRITSREVAREFINTHLQDFPEIVQGEYLVTFKTDRDENVAKSQSKNLALWVIALQTTIETGHNSYALLGSIFSQWAKDNLNIEWEPKRAAKVAKLYINYMQERGILNEKIEHLEYIDENGEKQTSIVVKLTETFKEMMKVCQDELKEKTYMICKPLTSVPEDWTDEENGVGELAGLKLIKSHGNLKGRCSQAVLDAVNKLQRVRFVIHPAIIDAAFDILDNQHEFNSTEEELRMYREIQCYEYGSYSFPVTLDTRGRMYYRGGILTPQGTDFCKAAFQFEEHVKLGDNGYKALLIHTANCLGYDKESLNGRVSKVQELIKIGAFKDIHEHTDVMKYFPDSDTYQALVAIIELNKLQTWLDNGNKIEEFESNLVCHQDGTCNGLQHMAVITKNRQTAITVNCVPSTPADKPSDIYGIIAEAAVKHVPENVQSLITKYGRSMAKNPVMIIGYGAGEETVISNTAKYLTEKGENSEHAQLIGKAYIKAIEENAGAVKALTEALKSRMTVAVQEGKTAFNWLTADGFVASTEYKDIEKLRIRAGVFNALMAGKPDTDEVKTVGAMSPNFIHSIDSAHARMVINDCNHSLVTIHDSIGSHAGNYFKTSRSIREQFTKVHEFDALSELCQSIECRVPRFRGNYCASEALESSYIFS